MRSELAVHPPVSVIFGAGNVGRGFIGQLFSESGLSVVFVDVDTRLVEALNSRGAYTLRLVNNEQSADVLVKPVRALTSGDVDRVASVLAEANLAATAVGARALPQVAPLLAAGISRRAQRPGSRPLNVIVCENLPQAAFTLRQMVGPLLQKDGLAYARTNVGFVDAVIGRMVPQIDAESRERDYSLVIAEPYRELPVDRSGFVGPAPTIVGMELCSGFGAYTARKLYVHNAGHAMLGYWGHLHGHCYGYQALDDRKIRPLLEAALAESQAGIQSAFGVEAAWLEEHVRELLRRFANRALGDTVLRLARDPWRKLGPEDRLVGAARLAERAGVVPEALSWGIAAALCFDDPRDPLALSLQQRIAAVGLEAVLAEVSGLQPDELLTRRILRDYEELKHLGAAQAAAWA